VLSLVRLRPVGDLLQRVASASATRGPCRPVAEGYRPL
jgi:hypothetical protein